MKTKTLTESSELLRMTLPLMSKYDIPVTPRNYAVWYHYVTGENFPLKVKIDSLISNEQKIDNQITMALYREFIDPQSEFDQADQFQKTLLSIAKNVSTLVDNARGEAGQYQKSLEKYEKRAVELLDSDQFQILISDLVNLTQNMQETNASLMQDLVDARQETEVLKQELEVAKSEAKTDPLTKLSNRKALSDYIHEMSVSGEIFTGSHCIVIADIDNFKLVNDSYGHLFGDRVLVAVAEIFKGCTRGRDLPVRFGGEEFALLLPNTSLEGAETVAENIRKNMEEGRIVKPKTGEEVSQITISLGVTQISPQENFEESIARADQALYRAKSNGRNKVEVARIIQSAAG